MPNKNVKAKRRHPTAQEMDERIVAPEGTTFEDVVESLVAKQPAGADLKDMSENRGEPKQGT